MIFAATISSLQDAETVTNYVLGFDQILNVPQRDACGLLLPAALLDDRFERPVRQFA
jgi:hypothetical protein